MRYIIIVLLLISCGEQNDVQPKISLEKFSDSELVSIIHGHEWRFESNELENWLGSQKANIYFDNGFGHIEDELGFIDFEYSVRASRISVKSNEFNAYIVFAKDEQTNENKIYIHNSTFSGKTHLIRD